MSGNLLPQAEAAMRKYAMLAEGDGVVVACSGGPDSLALLGVLCELRARMRLSITAVYVNHGLRPEAPAEGAFVQAQAQQWGVDARICHVGVNLHSGNGSLQAQAREERYRILHEVAHDVGAKRIAVGHTADDQMETLVMRFLRGTGSQGLGGIPPVNEQVIRPLLFSRRSDTEAYCQAHQLNPVFDASNAKDDYLRNQIRHHLMPVLLNYNTQLPAVLQHLADVARADHDWMEHMVVEFLAGNAVCTDGGWWCGTSALSGQPIALQRRVVRTLVRRVRALAELAGQELEFAHTESVLQLITQNVTGTRLPLPGGVLVWIEKGGFWVGPELVSTPYSLELPVPGEVQLPSGLCVKASLCEGARGTLSEVDLGNKLSTLPWQANGSKVKLMHNAVLGALTVRNRLPGDKYRPVGLQGEKKLQDIFVDAGIPRRWRDRLPVVADSTGILWVPGARPAHRVRLIPGATTILALEVIH